MASLTFPLVWSTLPPISVDLSPPSLPASSLTLPLAWSHLPSILSSMQNLLAPTARGSIGESGKCGATSPFRPIGVDPETDTYRARFDAEPRGPIVPRMIAADTERLTASLPAGHLAR